MAAPRATVTTAFHHCTVCTAVSICSFAVCVYVCIFHLNEQFTRISSFFANRCIVVWPHIQSNLTLITHFYLIFAQTHRQRERMEITNIRLLNVEFRTNETKNKCYLLRFHISISLGRMIPLMLLFSLSSWSAYLILRFQIIAYRKKTTLFFVLVPLPIWLFQWIQQRFGKNVEKKITTTAENTTEFFSKQWTNNHDMNECCACAKWSVYGIYIR